MRKPFIISLALHALVLIFAVVTFPNFGDKLPAPPTPLPVDLVTQAELTKIKTGTRDAKEDAAKADKKPQPPVEKVVEKQKPEPKVKSVKAPAPKPEPKPEKAEPAPKKAEPEKPEPKKEVAKANPGPVPMPARKPAKPVVKPEPKVAAKKPSPAPEEKKEDFNPDKIAALLNKVPDAGPKPAPKPAPEPQQKPEPAMGREQGRDLAMTFNEIDAVRARISQCWNPPVGGLGADAIQVKLRLQLTQEGSLTTAPQVMNRSGSPFFQAAADAAVRAVMLCQPYELPTRKYALWRDMILNFDPREMYGG